MDLNRQKSDEKACGRKMKKKKLTKKMKNTTERQMNIYERE